MRKIKIITIKIPSPFTALLLGIAFVAIVVTLAPVEYAYTGSVYSWIYIELCIIAMFLGLALGRKSIYFKTLTIPFYVQIDKFKLAFNYGLFLGTVGITLRIIDKYVIRGASFHQSMIENREVLVDSGINAFSITSSFLYPLVLFLPFFYLVLKRVKRTTKVQTVAIVLVSLYPLIDGLLFGSRSIIMIWLLLNFSYLFVLGYFRFKLTYLIPIVILFFLFNGYLFDHRTRLIGIDPIESTQTSVYAFFLPLKASTATWIETIENPFFYFFSLGVFNFLQYMGHGLFELLYLVDNFSWQDIYLGKQDFAVVYKFIYKVLNIPFSFEDNQAKLVRTGTYTTLFGPIYYDFAFFGVVFVFFLGLLIGYLTKLLTLKKSILLFPIYLYSLLLLFFSLVVNLITFAQGIYNLSAFLLFYFSSILILKIKFTRKKNYEKSIDP